MKKPSLLVLAAGLGSRYGSLKQIDKFGPNGETIVDYAIYDAIEAGFEKIVFVIRESIEAEFKEIFINKLADKVQIEYVFQELDVLPEGFQVPEGREKPWGTAHAVMTAAPKIQEPFAIVNADDFYGRKSLETMYNHLITLDDSKLDACLVGFVLENTLSEHGRVSRGICQTNDHSELTEIIERTHIFKKESGGAYYEEDGNSFDLTGKEMVSMNLMGFTSQVFEVMQSMFVDFLKKEGQELKSEFFIPSVLDQVRQLGVKVPVLTSEEQWFGVTYQEDKPIAKRNLNQLVDAEIYPQKLWK
ncbi:Nucleotidyl transferase [Reichenbachiella faecimaris]|uniref:Nucleotidyl transferase n=2 Tax=Reichenbachiella faecimaris TaxID=692418 RepID=A0A1W2GAW4_REIFA|nr:Nucleotidyl transferase [Reichenbachiella faecimaris]